MGLGRGNAIVSLHAEASRTEIYKQQGVDVNAFADRCRYVQRYAYDDAQVYDV